MNNDRKVRSLGFIAAFLLVTNIIMLVFFLGIKDGRKNSQQKGNVVGGFLQKEVGFDSKQMEQYQVLKKADMDSLTPYFDSLHLSKEAFYKLVSVGDVSDSTMASKLMPIGARQMKVDEQMLVHFKKVRDLCRPDQLAKFDSSFGTVINKITSGRRNKNH